MSVKDMIVHGILELTAQRDAAQAEAADLRRQLAEAQAQMADMRRAEYARGEMALTQEKLQDALNSIAALTRERDEMEAIAERTHGELLRMWRDLDAALKRAETQRDTARAENADLR